MRYALAILGVLIAVGCPTPEEPSLSEETQEATVEAPPAPEAPEPPAPEAPEEKDTEGLVSIPEEYLARFRLRGTNVASPSEFVDYLGRIRRLLPEGSQTFRSLGTPLRPHEKALDFNGEYSPEDARGWEIPYHPEIIEEEGVFQLTRPVLIHEGYFQVVLLEERLTPDGEYTCRKIRVLDSRGERYYIPVF